MELPRHDNRQVGSGGQPSTEEFRYRRVLDKNVRDLQSDMATKAPVNSPTFTGDPQAPTPGPSDDDTSIATTEWVNDAIAAALGSIPIGITYVASGTLSGSAVSIPNIPAHKLLVLQFVDASHNDTGNARFLRVALSSNNGSSYGTAHQLSGTSASGNDIHGTIFIGTVDGGSDHYLTTGLSFGERDTGVSGDINAIQISFSGGSFDNGRYILFAI
jgi:hypothetical protein